MSTLPPGFTPSSPDEPPRTRRAERDPGPAVVVHHHGINGRQFARWLGGGCLAAVVSTGLLGVGVAMYLNRSAPSPPEGVRVGRALAPAVTDALADGFDAEAKALDAGKPVAEANQALKDTFHQQRESAFSRIGGPYLSRLLPEKTEPTDDAQRHDFAAAHRDIAQGLREGGK